MNENISKSPEDDNTHSKQKVHNSEAKECSHVVTVTMAITSVPLVANPERKEGKREKRCRKPNLGAGKKEGN